MILLSFFTQKSWEIYVLGVAVVLLSILVCVLMLYIIAKKTNQVEKACQPLPETQGDKDRKQPPNVRPEALQNSNIKIVKDSKGFKIIDAKTKEVFGFAYTMEEAKEIETELARSQKPQLVIQNRKGEDGEMVSYVNDKSMQI